jgi:hypothetical protein
MNEPGFFDAIIVNDDLDRAYADLKGAPILSDPCFDALLTLRSASAVIAARVVPLS